MAAGNKCHPPEGKNGRGALPGTIVLMARLIPAGTAVAPWEGCPFHPRQDQEMRITVWLVTRDRGSWIVAGEVVLLALLLSTGGPALRAWLGVPVLAHLGYLALTSLPIGEVPGRPTGVARQRRNQHLRTRVVAFLNDVRRAETERGHRLRG